MNAEIPNLEKIINEVDLTIKEESKRNEQIHSYLKGRGLPLDVPLNLDCLVFKQTWGSTATAFDVDEKGLTLCGGAAMTEAYTVVVSEPNMNIYYVYVDCRPCYKVWNPSEKFFEDLSKRQLKSKREALRCY